MAALVQATNGNLYGTTGAGGMFQGGTVFEITPTGSLTTLYSFKLVELAGAGPNALVQATDGNFYGTTSVGGTHTACPGGCGSVFRLTIAGKYTNLYNFCSRVDCPDGASPQGTLIQATDGNLYGTTALFGSGGGGGAGGTVFKITPVGLTTIHSFCAQSGCPDGSESSGGLTQATNGTFYGTTAAGGNSANCGQGCGTVYSLSTGLGPFVTANPSFGRAGQSISILGNNLSGATSVTFNGKATTFTVVSSTYLKAKVPTGATTGKIKVTTPSRTLSSNLVFHVIP